MRQTQVLIAGCGPVGMTMAMDLARRGIAVTVVEQADRRQPPASAKCNHISARTMETFRRLGIAGDIRDAQGLPYDYANDVAHRTRVTGYEIARIPIPCRRDRYTEKSGPDGWWPTAEPPHRLNQLFMEPAMFECFEKVPGITFLNETRLDGFIEDESGVTATVTDLPSGETSQIRAAYIVGADGTVSTMRRAIGAKFEGDAELYLNQSSLIRAPDLLARMGPNPPWMVYIGNPERNGSMFAIDGRELWVVHCVLKPGETFESADAERDANLRTLLGVEDDFPIELVSKQDWTARRLVASRFRKGRAFICGDAAHAWVPMAGYGMNAGIASAIDLSWQMAAVLNGWAPETMLDAFEAERGPIEEQVSKHAMGHAMELMKRRKATPATIEDDSPEGEAARAMMGPINYDADVQQFCCGGLNFGYYYDRSPIIVYDGEAQPDFTMYDFTPSTVPGCRLPWFELEGGVSLYDRLGPEYTLVRLDPAVDVAPLVAAAASRNMPLEVLDVEGPLPASVSDAYRHKLTIARPDHHVAWRGDAAPADSLALVDTLRGAGL